MSAPPVQPESGGGVAGRVATRRPPGHSAAAPTGGLWTATLIQFLGMMTAGVVRAFLAYDLTGSNTAVAAQLFAFGLALFPSMFGAGVSHGPLLAQDRAGGRAGAAAGAGAAARRAHAERSALVLDAVLPVDDRGRLRRLPHTLAPGDDRAAARRARRRPRRHPAAGRDGRGPHHRPDQRRRAGRYVPRRGRRVHARRRLLRRRGLDDGRRARRLPQRGPVARLLLRNARRRPALRAKSARTAGDRDHGLRGRLHVPPLLRTAAGDGDRRLRPRRPRVGGRSPPPPRSERSS